MAAQDQTGNPPGTGRVKPIVRHRRRGRKLAMQAIFMLDALGDWEIGPAREFLFSTEPAPTEGARDYALRLIQSVLDNREELDDWLDQVHPKWKLKRMPGEDRSILRTGAAEIWYHLDVPANVSINEWIEVTKIYCGEESPRFVNGVLDRAASERRQETGDDVPG